MLKHASLGGLGSIPANGQIRGNISVNGPRSIQLRPQQPLNMSSLSAANGHIPSTTAAAAAVASASSAALALNSTLHIPGSGLTNGNGNGNGNGSLNGGGKGNNGAAVHRNGNGNGNGNGGGQRSPKTVAVTSTSSHAVQVAAQQHSQAQGQTPTQGETTNHPPSATTSTASSVTPPNPVLNMAGNNLHTYTNQHIALANALPENAGKTNGHHNNNASYYHHIPHPQTPNHSLLYPSSYPPVVAAVHHQLPNHHHHHHQHNHIQQQQNHQPNQTSIPPPRQPPPPQPAPAAFGNTTLPQSPHHYASGVLINQSKHGPGPREALTSLGLLCLLSLLLALLSLIFLLKISPNSREDAHSRTAPEDFIIVYDVTLALCTLSLSLNLCCLLVCAIQFLFAVKLVRSPMFDGRDNRYLEKSSTSRICAVGGFFISIPIFLTGIILYTFNHFHSTPAIITSVLIGFGIIFCGGAMVHNVFLWQKEKTISYRTPPLFSQSLLKPSPPGGGVATSCLGNTTGTGPGLHYHLPSPPLHLMTSASSSVCPITPPAQFLNHQGGGGGGSVPPHHQMSFNHHHSANASLILQPAATTTVTPVSPNHSHTSFNPLTTLSSTFLMRPSTTTPPTPKSPLMANGCLAGLNAVVPASTATTTTANGREASGSISPALPTISNNLDLSVMTNASLHELSTLV